MENSNTSNNDETNTFLESLNGLTHADASQKVFEKLNEVVAEGGESGLRDSDWENTLRDAYSKTNPHSDEVFVYPPVKDGE